MNTVNDIVNYLRSNGVSAQRIEYFLRVVNNIIRRGIPLRLKTIPNGVNINGNDVILTNGLNGGLNSWDAIVSGVTSLFSGGGDGGSGISSLFSGGGSGGGISSLVSGLMPDNSALYQTANQTNQNINVLANQLQANANALQNQVPKVVEEKDNTMLYVGIGFGALALLGVTVYLYKNKKD
jgi:hypothetical protein